MGRTDPAGKAGDTFMDRVHSITKANPDERVHSVTSGATTSLTWEYGSTRAGLAKLYERAKS
ncbi:MAG: hypothetical protein M3450_13655, partial [Actinomycetota bacterium]|nr:hypothetical protein [Actinomycetota bacterium]